MDGRRDRDSDHDELSHSARRTLTMSPYSIILADDHVLVRQGLRRILEGMPELEVVGKRMMVSNCSRSWVTWSLTS